MRRSQGERGLTFVSVLLVLAVAAGVYWALTFGPVYWDNHEVRADLRQAANLAYTVHEDKRVRESLLRSLDDQFGYDGLDANGKRARLSKLEFEDDDLRLDRQASPPLIRIDLRYARTLTLPIFGGQRRIWFNDHVEQDLSLVKW